MSLTEILKDGMLLAGRPTQSLPFIRIFSYSNDFCLHKKRNVLRNDVLNIKILNEINNNEQKILKVTWKIR